MKEAIADLWSFPAEYRCVTTNGVVGKSGLVMGAGVALEAKNRFPGLPLKLGQWVRKFGNRPFICREERLITFPTKRHWRDMLSDVTLIWTSAKQIVAIADKFSIKSIVLPRPGCGCGGLDWRRVGPSLKDILDDRFTVVSQ